MGRDAATDTHRALRVGANGDPLVDTMSEGPGAEPWAA